VDQGLLQKKTIQYFQKLRLLDLTGCQIRIVEFFLRKCGMEISWLCLDEVVGMVKPRAIEAFELFKGLRVLQMRWTPYIKELPASVGNLIHLLELDLQCCKGLQSLPHQIGHLTQFKILQLFNCEQLEEVPPSVSQLINLEYLGLSCCSKLVSMIEFQTQMDHLYELNLSDCSSLRIPFKSLGKLHQLRTLDMHGCGSLVIENPSESFRQLSRLEKLNLVDCKSLIPRFCLGSST